MPADVLPHGSDCRKRALVLCQSHNFGWANCTTDLEVRRIRKLSFDTALGLTRPLMVLAVSLWTASGFAQNPAWEARPRAAEPVMQSRTQPPSDHAGAVADDPAVRAAAYVTEGGPSTLPNQRGQVWREYDLTPFTSQAAPAERPEQNALDWILRETGTDTWFGDTVSLLSVSRERVRAYHTPEVHERIGSIVSRLIAPEVLRHVLGVRLVTVGDPDWRLRGLAKMQRIQVQSPGVDAWLMAREDAAWLFAELGRRSDFQTHSPVGLEIPHGRSHRLEQFRPRLYAQGLELTPQQWSGYQLQQGEIQEGFSLQLSPLFSEDGSQLEVAIDCQVDQIERMAPLGVDVPTAGNPRQRVQLQIPQISSWRLRERIRWPSDKVLVVSRGLAAMPGLESPRVLDGLVRLNTRARESGRAEAILILDTKLQTTSAGLRSETGAVRVGSLDSRGRY